MYGYHWTLTNLNHATNGARVLKTHACRSTGVHLTWWPCLASCASWPSTDVALKELGQLYGASLTDDPQ